MIDLKIGAGLKIDAEKVPNTLRALIPLIERWGFESQEDQDSFAQQMLVRSPADVEFFNNAIDQHREQIIAWGRTLKEFDQAISTISPEGWAHPYWSFLATLKMRELTESPNSAKMVAARARVSAEARLYRFQQIDNEAANLFREKDFAGFVRLMEPFEDLLSDSQKKKLDLARKRTAD